MRRSDPAQQSRVWRKPPSAVALRGPVRSFNHDGMEIVRHRVARRVVPWHGLTLILVTVLLFKAAMHISLGAANYDARVAEFADGNAVQQAAGWVLRAEPVTVWLSSTLQSFVR